MKKENVFVVIDTKKKAEKSASLLNMFNQYSLGYHMLNRCLSEKACLYYSVTHGCWSWVHYDDVVKKRKEVSVSELKQILALEHLKKGDVVVCDLGNEKWIVEFSHFDTVEPFKLISFKWNYKGDTAESVRGGYFNKFIRYATEEEKQLLNPAEKEFSKETRDFPNDFKEVETKSEESPKGVWRFIKKQEDNELHKFDALIFDNCNDVSFGFNHSNQYTNSYGLKYNRNCFIRDAKHNEVSERFFKECHDRYPNKIGFSFNNLTNEIISADEIIFKNGTWLEAKKIEIDPFKELKEAHKKGFEIEYKSSSGQWKTSSNPAWRKTGNYRIRPVKIGDWFFTTHEQTNVKYYYQVNETNINDVKPNHVRILNQMVIDILNNGKYTV